MKNKNILEAYYGNFKENFRLKSKIHILRKKKGVSDTYVNLDTDKVFIHFLIFRVSNMSYNNIKINSTSKIAERGGHEHVIISFVVQGSEHSLLTQQEIEGFVYQI